MTNPVLLLYIRVFSFWKTPHIVKNNNQFRIDSQFYCCIKVLMKTIRYSSLVSIDNAHNRDKENYHTASLA